MTDAAPPTARPRRRWPIVVAALLPLLLVLGAVTARRGLAWYRNRLDDQDYARATKYLAEGRKGEAAFITSLRLGRVATASGARDERALRWYRLDIACAVKSANTGHLVQLYERVPELVLDDEDASTRVALTMVVLKQFDKFHDLREHWRGREKNAAWWLAVDVEAAQREGHRDEALKLLETRVLPGRDDSVRLLRLAMLHGEDDPSTALKFLDQAFAADPKNADVRSVRALQFERNGELERARVEYVSAQMSEPENPLRTDMLAEFYHRRGDFIRMVKTLAAGQRKFGPEGMRLKLDFWSRVAYPGDQTRAEADPGELRELLGYIERLPAGTFWDEAAFLALPGADVYLRKQQETFWLRLLQMLKVGRDADALDLLGSNAFRDVSWQKDLEISIAQCLRLRVRGEHVGASRPADAPPPAQPLLVLLGRLGAAQRDDDVAGAERVLTGPYGFAAVLIAIGWNEAGLRLMPDLAVLPADAPSWLAIEVTQALRWNRSFEDGLAYAQAQRQTPDLALVEAEMLIVLKRRADAQNLLAPLARDPAVGVSASWMLATMALEDRDADRADAILAANKDLAENLHGRELTARAAVVRNRDDDADRLYGAIADRSAEGALWMMQRAYARKDYTEAQKWTATLVKLQPGVLDPSQAPQAGQ